MKILSKCTVCSENIMEGVPMTTCYCDASCCIGCLEKWILANPEREAGCVNCRRIFPQEYLYTVLSPEFMRDHYTPWREHYLFLREMPYLAEDMDVVAIERDRRKMFAELQILYKKKKKQCRSKSRSKLSTKDLELQKEIDALRQVMPPPLLVSSSSSLNPPIEKKATIVMPCGKIGCRGYVTTRYECMLCRTEYCRECMGVSDDKHECKDEDVKSAKDIMGRTKACPRCAVRIYKIEGCDQMWCVCCHCVFNWSEGIPLNTTQVHNPHYFEWLFSDRGVNDVNVHRNVHHHDDYDYYRLVADLIYHKQHGVHGYQDQITSHLQRMLRDIRHIEQIDRHKYRNTREPVDVGGHTTHRDLRLRFLLNEIEESDVKRLLYKREKRQLRRSLIYELLGMTTQAIRDIVLRFVDSPDWDYTPYQKELLNILDVFYERLKTTKTHFGGCQIPEISQRMNALYNDVRCAAHRA